MTSKAPRPYCIGEFSRESIECVSLALTSAVLEGGVDQINVSFGRMPEIVQILLVCAVTLLEDLTEAVDVPIEGFLPEFLLAMQKMIAE